MKITPLALCFLASCTIHLGSGPTHVGSGVFAEDQRSTPDFHAIELDGSFDVRARIGAQTSVTVSGDDNLLEFVLIDVRNGVLHVDLERGSYQMKESLVVHVTTPILRAVVLDGSGDISVEGLAERAFSATLDGSGDISATGEVDELEVILDGSGDITLTGLRAREAAVELDGSGDVEVFVEDSLRVDIDGSGDVAYRERPSIDVDVSIDGSGEIRMIE